MSDKRLHLSYNHVHKLCKKGAEEIQRLGKSIDLIIAIGGGGFIPARILRSFLKREGTKNIPIQAIGLSLYEQMTTDGYSKIGKEVIRTQWIDWGNLNEHFDSLIGKNVLVVDEVDDTRTTLSYALTELEKDVKSISEKLNKTDVETTFSIFVLQNKQKAKKASIPDKIVRSGRFFVGEEVPDEWVIYPWDAMDIDEHTVIAKAQGND